MIVHEQEQNVAEARKRAIARIETAMQPAADALHRSRKKTDPYWIKRELECDGCIRAIWSDQGYDLRSEDTWLTRSGSVQLVVPDDVSPEMLAHVAPLILVRSAEIEREALAEIEAHKVSADLLIAAYDRIVRSDAELSEREAKRLEKRD